MRVLLDANALMMPVQFGIDLFGEIESLVGAYEAVTLEDVLDELSGLARGRGRDAAAARVGLSLASKCTVVRSRYPEIPVDERLVRHAGETGCMVVTNDRILRNTLLEQHIDVISLRKQKKLEILRS